jgi:hypothetical protein
MEGISIEALYLQTRHTLSSPGLESEQIGQGRAEKDDGWVWVRTSWMNIAITIYVDGCLLDACLEIGLLLCIRRLLAEPL